MFSIQKIDNLSSNWNDILDIVKKNYSQIPKIISSEIMTNEFSETIHKNTFFSYCDNIGIRGGFIKFVVDASNLGLVCENSIFVMVGFE